MTRPPVWSSAPGESRLLAAVLYKVLYKPAHWRKKERTRIAASPFVSRSSGGRIRTSDLRVMSPTSYQAALPRDLYLILADSCWEVKPRELQGCRVPHSSKIRTLELVCGAWGVEGDDTAAGSAAE